MSHHMPLHTNTEATQNEHREREADHPSECSEPSEQTCHGDKPVRDRREKFEHTRDTLDSTPKTSNHEQRKNTPAARFGNPKPGTRKRHAASSTQEAKQDGKRTRQPFDGKERLYEVIKVRLVRSQRLIEVNTNEKKIMPNMTVLVRVHRNVLLATTIGHRYRRVAEINALPYILRHANAQDVEIDRQNQAIEKRAQELATTYALDHALQMKVLSADLSHDHKNITINFASDVRVDFREMVAFLASHLKLHVEMYQLGLRNGTGL
ncbi:MAG: PSP1 domain-containing protein, partial [Proteobacteria bacterium]|nr:PSP1 domain-containing protein [Pseudomonadota bacterium]